MSILITPPAQAAGGSGPITVVAGSGLTVTGTTSNTSLGSATIPGGSVGPNGTITVKWFCQKTGTAGTERILCRFGGATNIRDTTHGSAILTVCNDYAIIWANGSESSQLALRSNAGTTSLTDTQAAIAHSVDTTSDFVIDWTVTPGSAADSITLTRYEVIVAYGA